MIRTYTELSQLGSFMERFEYLKLGGAVGRETFGFDRYLNQALYNCYEWKEVRMQVMLRDSNNDGVCDLGINDRLIFSRVLIHHMNPISIEDIQNRNPDIFNPEYLISTSHNTHNAIHYGDESLIVSDPIIRRPNDTIPWR